MAARARKGQPPKPAPAPPKRPAPKLQTIGVEVLARLLTLDARRIQQLAKEGVLPKAGRGRYELEPCVQAYVDYLRAGLPERDPDDPVSLETYRKRRTRAETELVELALEEARAQVCPVDVVLEVVGTAIENARARFQAFPGRYAGRFARIKSPSKMKTALQAAVREVLIELSDGSALTDRAREASRGSRIVRGAARGKS